MRIERLLQCLTNDEQDRKEFALLMRFLPKVDRETRYAVRVQEREHPGSSKLRGTSIFWVLTPDLNLRADDYYRAVYGMCPVAETKVSVWFHLAPNVPPSQLQDPLVSFLRPLTSLSTAPALFDQPIKTPFILPMAIAAADNAIIIVHFQLPGTAPPVAAAASITSPHGSPEKPVTGVAKLTATQLLSVHGMINFESDH